MADFATDSTRIDSGKSLNAMKTQGINAVNQLKNLKINIVALKAEVQANEIYTTDDATAVQTVIEYLLAEIATI